MSTIHTLAADIASRIPDMAKDSPLNNQQLIENLVREFMHHHIKGWVYGYEVSDQSIGLAERTCLPK